MHQSSITHALDAMTPQKALYSGRWWLCIV